MATIERTSRVSAPRSAVRDYVLDFSNSTTWNPAIISLHLLVGDGSEGTLYYGLRRWNGEDVFVMYTIEERRDGECLQVTGHADTFVSQLTIRVDDRSDLVRVTVMEDVVAEVDATNAACSSTVNDLSDALALTLSDALASL